MTQGNLTFYFLFLTYSITPNLFFLNFRQKDRSSLVTALKPVSHPNLKRYYIPPCPIFLAVFSRCFTLIYDPSFHLTYFSRSGIQQLQSNPPSLSGQSQSTSKDGVLTRPFAFVQRTIVLQQKDAFNPPYTKVWTDKNTPNLSYSTLSTLTYSYQTPLPPKTFHLS